MDTNHTLQAGALGTYTDLNGRQQLSVDGPHGQWLITRRNDRESFTVWKSDSLSTTAATSDRAQAIEIAMRAAGVL